METIIDGVVYRVYSQNGVEIKEYVRMEKAIMLTYEGSSIHIAVLAPDTYSGPLRLKINGTESIVTVSGGTTDVPYTATSYDVMQAQIEGYADGHLVLGAPTPDADRIDQLEADNAMLMLALAESDARQAATDQTVADLMLAIVSGGV